MATSTDIANVALTLLGEPRITALTDDTKGARACRAVYDRVRAAELRANPWNCAITRTSLPALADAPAWGYVRQFQLPADCLRVLQVGEYHVAPSFAVENQLFDAEYLIEGRKILTNLSAPLAIRYVKNEEDVQQYDPLLVRAIGHSLAIEVCEDLTASTSKRQDIKESYGVVLAQAMQVNAIERPPETLADDSWIAARR